MYNVKRFKEKEAIPENIGTSLQMAWFPQWRSSWPSILYLSLALYQKNRNGVDDTGLGWIVFLKALTTMKHAALAPHNSSYAATCGKRCKIKWVMGTSIIVTSK